MPADSPRILELRRRVQSDPSSIAFAQLGEELRRAGGNDEAIEVCRAGLARHPGYLSARVTLGRALVELDRLPEAHHELAIVVEAAPDNLAAIRGLAEIHQRQGEMREALAYYRRALELARHDPELEETVERMEKEVAPPAPPEPEVSVEALFDFDRLVEQLGAETPPGVKALDALTAGFAPPAPVTAAPTPTPLPPDTPADTLTALEAGLREREAQGPEGVGLDLAQALAEPGVVADEAVVPPVESSADGGGAATGPAASPEAEALSELEGWLDALRSQSR